MTPSTFQKAALRFTAAAAIFGTSAFAAFPAHAQQARQVNYKTPDCATIDVTAKRLVCESFQRADDAKKRGAAAEKRGAAADARAEAAQSALNVTDASTKCMEEIGKKIDTAKKAGPLSVEQKTMFKAQIERCDKG